MNSESTQGSMEMFSYYNNENLLEDGIERYIEDMKLIGDIKKTTTTKTKT